MSHLGKLPPTKTDEFSEKFRRGGGGHFQSKNFCCKFWTFEQGFFGIKMIKRGIFRVCFSIILREFLKKKFSWDTLGKHHHKNIAVHLGIAQIAIGPPSPHSNGHSVAPIFGQNHANARLYMDISPKNRCHKPSWQGFRPPPKRAMPK